MANDSLITNFEMKENNDREFSNVTHIIPEIGMEVELRDPDFIWSGASIVKVQINEDDINKTHLGSKSSQFEAPFVVSLRYIGWGSEWDEVLPWPHPRIARLFTYTKRVKCLFHMTTSSSAKRKRNKDFTVTWPCNVHLRMPHPKNKHAEQMLREEINVFIKVYGDKIPKEVTSFLPNAKKSGWVNRNRLRQWKKVIHDTLTNSDTAKAWEITDASTPCTLPMKPFEAGTLLRDVHRVQDVGGSMVNGQMYYGGFESLTNASIGAKSKTSEKFMEVTDFDESSDDEVSHHYPVLSSFFTLSLTYDR